MPDRLTKERSFFYDAAILLLAVPPMITLPHHSVMLPVVGVQPTRLPLFSHKVAAGFPSPADDYIEGRLSLDEHLIQHR